MSRRWIETIVHEKSSFSISSGEQALSSVDDWIIRNGIDSRVVIKYMISKLLTYTVR